MLALYYSIGAVAVVAVVVVGLLLHYKAPKKLNICLKTVSLVLATAFVVRYMSARDVLEGYEFFVGANGPQTKALVWTALLQVWLAYAVEVLVMLAPFFKVKTVPALVSFVGGAVFLVNFAMMFNHVSAICGNGVFQPISADNPFGLAQARAMLIALETGLGLGYCVVNTVVHCKQLVLRKWEWLWFALAFVGMVLASVPPYLFQVTVHPNSFQFVPNELNYYHRLWLYPAVIIPIVLYLLLKDKSLETKRMALLYYAWQGLILFSMDHRLPDFIGPDWAVVLPLHLCNTAMYITPLCLTFKWKKFFYFTYFINVLGALLALTVPNTSEYASMLDATQLTFYISHYHAFFMPLLVVGLGVFKRPRLKEFIYSMIGFTVYFILMVIVNAWFTNYNKGVDYFFINSNFIAEKLGGWAENLRISTWQFQIKDLTFTVYPLYQFIYWLVYILLALAVWFVYELGFNVVSGWQDIALRNKKIRADKLALEVNLAGRSIEQPMNMENTNKLILKNFTKRYGRSDVYAVKDANLVVEGGEIYGFLGPNGAGKSTIIKSIVGIQTITDGAIEVCGYDVATQSVQAKTQIGFVPDHYALYERLTAREYINYIADLYGVSKADRDERLANYVELFEFQAAIDTPIRTYSHGMKQKVTIMSALIHNPKVWILDEPLTGLDPNSIFQVKECMKRHAAEGNIVFFSSHIIDVVERICDKIAIIRKGQIQCVRDVHQMERDGESLEAFYMEVINGKDVQPIAVNAEAKE